MKPEEAIGIFEAVKGLYKSPLLIEAMNTATKAIKELRKYQEIGTVEELKEIKNSLSLYKRYVDYLKKERDEVIEEVQQYREIGTVEEIKDLLATISEAAEDVDESGISVGFVKDLIQLKKYREIGTVEECREAVENQNTKKPVLRNDNGKLRKSCPVCGCFFSPLSRHCPKCGQAISWK